MATYKQIANWIRSNQKYKWVAQTCWIAHCKEIAGLSTRHAANRFSDKRIKECPPNKQEAIFEAFLHFGMISNV